MANITKSGNGLVITSTGTQNDVLVLDDLLGDNIERQVLIEVIVGTFQFNVGRPVSADNAVLTAGMKKVMSLKKGFLNFVSGGASQSFNIDYV